eukprot:scaffold143597_cov30-Tisochrysis_lutea.AAC.2
MYWYEPAVLSTWATMARCVAGHLASLWAREYYGCRAKESGNQCWLLSRALEGHSDWLKLWPIEPM